MRIQKSELVLIVCLLFGFVILSMVIFTKYIQEKHNATIISRNYKSVKEENTNLTNRLKELKAVRTNSEEDISNYIQTYYRTIPPIVANEIAKQIILSSEKYDVPVVAIVGVADVESKWNPMARSSAGARGLMQVMPGIWGDELNLTSKYDLHNIAIGINGGTYVLRKYLNATNNNLKRALYKYVGGDELYSDKVYEAMGKFVVFRSFANLTIEDPTNNISHEDKRTMKTDIRLHIVKAGETLSSIAKLYTGNIMDWKKLQESNKNIIPEEMPIGIEIVIPTEWNEVNNG